MATKVDDAKAEEINLATDYNAPVIVRENPKMNLPTHDNAPVIVQEHLPLDNVRSHAKALPRSVELRTSKATAVGNANGTIMAPLPVQEEKSQGPSLLPQDPMTIVQDSVPVQDSESAAQTPPTQEDFVEQMLKSCFTRSQRSRMT